MILPTKHMPHDKALLTVGSYILRRLDRQKTVSALWEEVLADYKDEKNRNPGISFDWFILTLDLLYAIEAIEIYNGLLRRRASL
ncbi:MAG: hypothetical protein GX941_09290 [Candidatus Methanofastidiosa archaeon]|nr:hypothetical protein [Candidatus Methanofastidiosa archaeon]NMA31979.1 hypothetical protein [Candidatus Methanofastidiosa archaeon]